MIERYGLMPGDRPWVRLADHGSTHQQIDLVQGKADFFSLPAPQPK